QGTVRVELPLEEPRDVPGPLHVEAERIPLPQEPVRGQEMAAEVARQNDHPFALCERIVEDVVAADGENRLPALIGHALPQEGARPPPDLIPGQPETDRGNVPV